MQSMANTQVVEKKKKIVEELKEKINSASVVILSDFRGIPVNNLTKLRKDLFKEDSEFLIFKNTLLKRALEDCGFASLVEKLEGPTALLLGYKDPAAPLKALVDFVADIEKGEIKSGILEKTAVDLKQINEVATLPPREVLLAKVVGGLKSPIYGLVNCLQGNIRGLVYVLKAVSEKKGGEK